MFELPNLSVPNLEFPGLDLPFNALCTSMLSDFDRAFASVYPYLGMITGPLDEIKDKANALGGLPASSAEAVESAVSSTLSIVDGIIDTIISATGIDRILEMIQACLALEGFDPLAMLNKLLDYIIKGILDALSFLADLIPEFRIALDLSWLNHILDLLNLGAKIPWLDRLLQCLDAICGADVSGRVESLTSFLGGSSIGDDGRMSPDDFLDSVSGTVSVETKTNIKTLYSTINSSFDKVKTRMLDSAELLG
jgi:hypothetical protein